jgi:hypothetical protein
VADLASPEHFHHGSIRSGRFRGDAQRWLREHPAELLVAAVVAWNAWSLRSTTDPVAYLDDSSLHQQMVRFASTSIRSGTLPVSQWFPFLNLGSPQFLHYQGLGATLTGAVGVAIGPDAAFRWSLYLMLVLWPIVIYVSARIFGLPGMAAGFAAVLSPFLMSAPAVGYEQQAYIWIGYGLWAQLCASWALPMAWAWAWRAMEERKYVLRAVIFVSATAALHFETGYLAFVAVIVFPLVRPSTLRYRLVNAAVVLAGSLIATAWVTVPLIVQSKWAALNTTLSRTGLVRGYGARQDLEWLFTGSTFDRGRLPVVTIAVGFGVVMAIVRWKRIVVTRALAVLFIVSLCLSFGPTTWSHLSVLVPGHADLYFRRFLMGVQLSGIYLAGFGIYLAGSMAAAAVHRMADRSLPGRPSRRLIAGLAPLTGFVLALTLLAPAWIQLRAYDSVNASQIGYQRRAEAAEAHELDPLLNYVRSARGGRLYAGSPSDWGARFTVGYVPVFKYAEGHDIDEVGYTIRTASLMSQPEVGFVASNLSDYQLFGVRYVLLPPAIRPEPWMRLVMTRGPYRLFVVDAARYLDTVHIDGFVSLGRADVGPATLKLLQSHDITNHRNRAVAWEGSRPTANASGVATNQQAWLSDMRPDLVNGTASARVHSTDGTTVVLSTSYDVGWQVTVDGRVEPTVQLAPAVVGVTVAPGWHTVRFTYHGFRELTPLVVLAIGGLVLVTVWSRRRPDAAPCGSRRVVDVGTRVPD